MISFKAHKKPAYGLAFSPDGRYLATCGADEFVRLFELGAGTKPKQLKEWPVKRCAHVTFSPDSEMLIASGKGLRVWSMTPNANQDFDEIYSVDEPGTGAVRFCGDDRIFAHGGRGLSSWQIVPTKKKGAAPTFKPVKCGWGGTRESNDNKQFPLHTCVCTPDGKSIIASFAVKTYAFDSSHIVFDLKTGKEKGRMQSTFQVDHPVAISLSPDGLTLVSTYGSNIGVWDVKTQKEIKRWSIGKKHLKDVTYTIDGTRIVAVANDDSVRQWETKKWTEVRTLEWKIGKLTALAVSADGCLIGAASHNGNVILWDAD